MDPFHERLARVALEAAGSFGFALAGGYAVQAHGFLSRMSADVDLFAEASAESDITQVVDVVIAAYLREGLEVETELRTASFARLDVRTAAEARRSNWAWTGERTNQFAWRSGLCCTRTMPWLTRSVPCSDEQR